MMPGGRTSWKSAGAGSSSVPDKFPAGLRVLVVDDDPVCLKIIEKMLKQCNYEVFACNRAEIGVSILRENRNGCDIVLSDVHMPDMDGFKLLEQIGLEMDIPVIMMSADDDSSVVMKGVTHGACDYIIKPVRIEALRNIWQHVVRKQKRKWKDSEPLTSPDDVDYTSSANEGPTSKSAKRRKDDEDEYEERDESSFPKKPRVVWTIELHQQFVAVVNQLGLEKAVPKKILELMNVPGITRENIASHLQKYRLYLRRLSESQHSGSFDASSFMDIVDPSYDNRALSVSCRLPGESLLTVLGRLNKSRDAPPIPAFDRRVRYGIPTNTQPNQFMSLHQPHHQSFNLASSQVLMPMAGQGQGQSQSQHVFPNAMWAHGLGSNVSGGGIAPSFNMLNDSNQNRPDPGLHNMTFRELLTYTSPDRTGPSTSFALDDESETHRGTGDNQDDLLAALLNQPKGNFGQEEDELNYDGYAFDDLP